MVSRPVVDEVAGAVLEGVRPWRGLNLLALLPLRVWGGGGEWVSARLGEAGGGRMGLVPPREWWVRLWVEGRAPGDSLSGTWLGCMPSPRGDSVC